MAYRFVPFPMTLNDLEGHLPVEGLISCNSTDICATFCTVLTDTARRASLGDRLCAKFEVSSFSRRSVISGGVKF